MLIVTGGAGFIGSNLVHALNARGADDLVVVDELDDPRKIGNLRGARLADLRQKDDLLAAAAAGDGWLEGVTAVLHQGACSSTTERDATKVLRDNLQATRMLLDACVARGVPFLYASSAAVYGANPRCQEEVDAEDPLNLYAWSKHLADQRVRAVLPHAASQVVGLRYFNVYGPREGHKDAMASVVRQVDDAVRTGRPARLFGAGAGCGPGGHRRDFVHVDDVVATVLWFLDHPDRSGIFNCGTGRAASFDDLAHAVISHRGRGEVDYVPFPPELEPTYQACTQADLTRLRATGCDVAFRPLADGVAAYLDWRDAHRD